MNRKTKEGMRLKMTIDLEKAKEEFIKYTEHYNLTDKNLDGKQKHSLRVMQVSEQIAKDLKLDKEEIELASLIGLLHDIARFEQYTRYKTFRDMDSIDHGDYGVEILEKDIRKYIETSQYDEIIKKAVKNHNKYKIEEGLSEKEELFAKIIRDADKIDIFYESVEIFWNEKKDIIENSTITEDVIKQFNECTQIKRRKERRVENSVNEIVSVIAFIFDINFKESLRIIKNENYVNKILDRYNIKDEYTKNEIEKIRTKANEYIEEKSI